MLPSRSQNTETLNTWNFATIPFFPPIPNSPTTGVIILPTQTMHYLVEIPQNYHRFALFGSLQMGSYPWSHLAKQRVRDFPTLPSTNRLTWSRCPVSNTTIYVPECFRGGGGGGGGGVFWWVVFCKFPNDFWKSHTWTRNYRNWERWRS